MSKVLLVDDEEEICQLLSGILRKEGFDTSYALSLQEAKHKLLMEDFSVAFVDLNLPDGVGFQLIPTLKNKDSTTKVIIITAYDVGFGEVINEGADYLIRKPFNRRIVKMALNDLQVN